MSRLFERFNRRDQRWIILSLASALTIPLATTVISRATKVTTGHDTRIMQWSEGMGVRYNHAMTMGFAGPNRLISLDSGPALREWDTESGREIKTLPLDQLSPNGSFVTLPVISPDGKWGATWGADAPSQFPMGHGQSTLIGVLPYTNPAEYILSWDLSTAQPIAAVRPTSRFSVSSLAFSPDGRWLALGGMSRQSVQDGIYKKQPSGRLRGELEVWDWRSGRSVWQGQVKSSVGCMAWSATGLLAEGGGDYVNYQIQGTKYSGIVNTSGEVNIWDPLRHKLMLHRSFASAPEAVALTPDAKELVVFETLRGLTAWNTHSGALRQELKGPVSSEGGVFMGRMHLIDSLAISGNGRWLASSGPNHDRILVWNLPGGTFHGEYTTTLWRNSQSQPTDDAYALSPDGQWLAVGSSNIREITLHRLSSD